VRVPTGAGVDVRVVDAGRTDTNQHLARCRFRDGHVVAKLELLEAAVTLEQHGLHRCLHLFGDLRRYHDYTLCNT
jgi:hypothetical protein